MLIVLYAYIREAYLHHYCRYSPLWVYSFFYLLYTLYYRCFLLPCQYKRHTFHLGRYVLNLNSFITSEVPLSHTSVCVLSSIFVRANTKQTPNAKTKNNFANNKNPVSIEDTGFFGAGCENRTRYLIITSDVLYRVS